jgi:hypothetical protein
VSNGWLTREYITMARLGYIQGRPIYKVLWYHNHER